MNVKKGDFVNARVARPGDDNIRQGIFDGDQLHGESGTVYKVVEVLNVVKEKNIWGRTLQFVKEWRSKHGM